MYYIVFCGGILLSFINDKKGLSFYVLSFLLTILSVFRYGVGIDYFAYNYLFDRLSSSLIYEMKYGVNEQELLFRLIGSAFKASGLSYQNYIAALAVVNMVFICKLCKKYSRNPTLSLLIYYCFFYFVWTFSGLRQGLVLSIGVYYLIECLNDKKIIKLIVISAALSLIHTSALFLIALYICANMDLNQRKLVLASCAAVIFSIMPIGNIIMKLTWLPYANRLFPYLNAGSVGSVLDFQSFARMGFLFMGLLYYNAFLHNDISRKIMNVYIISLIFYFIFKFSELTASRLSIYGFYLIIIVLPDIFYKYKKKNNKVIYIACLGILCMLFFNKELNSMGGSVGLAGMDSNMIPYTNVFNKDRHAFKRDYLLDLN